MDYEVHVCAVCGAIAAKPPPGAEACCGAGDCRTILKNRSMGEGASSNRKTVQLHARCARPGCRTLIPAGSVSPYCGHPDCVKIIEANRRRIAAKLEGNRT